LRVMLRNGGVTIADLWAHPNFDKA
ncbi:MAG: hypothetical protein JWN20_757, partial [Jatrophihabitantaceae bacterium]|nr:hypothetical protein [Jatrophihabitantaceae bacterium]